MDASPTPGSALEARLVTDAASLRLLALGILRVPADADDCVQEAAMRALERPPARNPAAWLRTVVRHLAYRVGRDATRRRRREEGVARRESAPSTAEIAQRIEGRRRLLAAVAALPEPYRAVVVLRYFEGRQPAEIATLTATPVKTVKTRLHRALEQLRASLSERDDGPHALAALLPIAFPRAGAEALASSAGIAALGGALLMKKLIVAVLVLLVVGAAWWIHSESSRETESGSRAPATRDGDAPAASLAAGAHKADPAKVTAPSPAGRLLESDAIPESAFAGRVVDEAGRGIAGAQVRLFASGADQKRGEPMNGWHLLLRREKERHDAPSVRADGDGYFRLDRPYGASATYVVAEAAGYSTLVTATKGLGTFVLLTLPRDRATRVVVSTESGSPVRDAEVRLLAPTAGMGASRDVLAVARTDAAGIASLPAIGDTGFTVEAAPQEPELGFASVAIGARQDRIEIRLPETKVVIRQIVDAESGQPIAGAYVDVLKEFPYASPENEPWRRRFRADASGRVRFPMQAGVSIAFAMAPGYELENAYQDPVRLAKATVIEGVVVDAEGKPVADAAVLVAIPGTGSGVFEPVYVGRSAVEAWSDAEGRFSIEVKLGRSRFGEPPPDRGTRTILAVKPGYAAAVEDGVRIEPGRRATITLRFPKSASLAITVVNADGAPVAGQWFQVVRVIPTPPGWPEPRHGGGVDTIDLVGYEKRATDAQGRAIVDRLPPGRHLVRVDTLTAEAELREGERTELRIVKGAGPRITGHLLDADGAPIKNSNVSLSGPEASNNMTDAQGAFHFEDLLPGEYRVGVMTAGRLPYSVTVKPGDDVTIRLPAGPARLRITVSGPPPGAWEASLITEPGGGWPDDVGFAPGSAAPLETPGFTPGVGVLVVRAKGFGWTVVRFDAPARATTDVAVTLVPSGSVVGNVADPRLGKQGLVRFVRRDGFPESVVGASERLRYGISRSKGDIHEHLSTDATGGFRAEDLPPGAYDVSYGHYEGATWVALSSARVEVAQNAAAYVELPR